MVRGGCEVSKGPAGPAARAKRATESERVCSLLDGRVGQAPHRRVVVRDAEDVLGLDQWGCVPQHGTAGASFVMSSSILPNASSRCLPGGRIAAASMALLIDGTSSCGQLVLLAGRIDSPLNVGLMKDSGSTKSLK